MSPQRLHRATKLATELRAVGCLETVLNLIIAGGSVITGGPTVLLPAGQARRLHRHEPVAVAAGQHSANFQLYRLRQS